MKLFFWRKKKVEEVAKPEVEEIKNDEFLDDFLKLVQTKNVEEEDKDLHKKYSVLSIKKWCDEKLSPVAWARIMLKTFSVLREHGYNFAEMQNPTASTSVDHNIYLIIRAAIIEIYNQDYKTNEEIR